MEQSSGERRAWYKISRVDTKGKILDISDPDPFPKIYDPENEEVRAPKYSLNYTEYDPSTFKSRESHRHWVDEEALDLLAWDLLTNRKGEAGKPIYEEYKGGPAKAAGVTELGDNGFVSRQFSVTYTETDSKGEKLRMGPVYVFRFTMSEGRQEEKGQIMPVRDGKVFLRAQITVPVALARRMGKRILKYLAAKETAAIVGEKYIDPVWRKVAQS